MLYIFQYKLLNINKIKKELQNVILQNVELKKSGWQDSNLRPPAPKAGAITGLRYTPKRLVKNKTHQLNKRRGRDSNPRYPQGYNSLAGSPIRPLWHLSNISVIPKNHSKRSANLYYYFIPSNIL